MKFYKKEIQQSKNQIIDFYLIRDSSLVETQDYSAFWDIVKEAGDL